MKVLMIDNYDSFTYNLVQYLGELGAAVEVVRNDQIDVEEILHGDASHVMVSPGPCTPNEANRDRAARHRLDGGRRSSSAPGVFTRLTSGSPNEPRSGRGSGGVFGGPLHASGATSHRDPGTTLTPSGAWRGQNSLMLL